MGRHRSTLRDLGWAASNSPNPWKQGSAKRVVRALDYSNVELDEPPSQSTQPVAQPAQAAQPAQPSRFDDRLQQQLQQEGSKKLDRIREQYEAEDAENKRKLDRLNGRIAELGEGKRHMWSILGQQQQKGKPETKVQPVAAEKAADAAPADGVETLRERQEAVFKAEATLASKEVLLNERLEKLQQAEEMFVTKEVAHEQTVTETRAQMTHNASAASKLDSREVTLAAREAKLAEDLSALRVTRATLADKEAVLVAKEAALLVKQQQFSAAASAAAAAVVGGSTTSSGVPPVTNAAPIATNDKPRANEPVPQSTAVNVPSKSQPELSTKAQDAESKDLPFDRTADWVRADNLTASLLQQQVGADQVFEPLQGNETCKLSDIFSNPRNRARGHGSGVWAPFSAEKSEPAKPATNAVAGKMQLVGVEGDYNGEIMQLQLAMGADGSLIIGRSSSCDVTLARDDQISRRHLQLEGRDGKIYVRDLGSTYGTWLNKKKLEGEQLLCGGDVLALGASSFQLKVLPM